MQDQWSYVFSNFSVSEIWEIGFKKDDLKIYQTTIPINNTEELPDRPIVILAHQDGRYIKGEQSLVTFNHPEDAIYIFGGSHSNLTSNREADLVFIPSSRYEMYSFAAANITLYDRYIKRGDFG